VTPPAAAAAQRLAPGGVYTPPRSRREGAGAAAAEQVGVNDPAAAARHWWGAPPPPQQQQDFLCREGYTQRRSSRFSSAIRGGTPPRSNWGTWSHRDPQGKATSHKCGYCNAMHHKMWRQGRWRTKCNSKKSLVQARYGVVMGYPPRPRLRCCCVASSTPIVCCGIGGLIPKPVLG
jgi:hypothetical protein